MTKSVIQQEQRAHQIKVINIHAKRLSNAYSEVIQFLPMTPEKLEYLTTQQLLPA